MLRSTSALVALRSGWIVLAFAAPAPPAAAQTCEAWTQTTGPPWRYGAAVIHDSARDRVLLFGGGVEAFDGTRTGLDDLWEYRSSTGWTRLADATGAPTGTSAAAVYDPVRDRMIVLASPSTVYALSLATDTTWSSLAITGTPPPSLRGAVYDPHGDRLVVLASQRVWAVALGEQTPQWIPLGATPFEHGISAFVHDTRRNRLVVFESAARYYSDQPRKLWALPLSAPDAWIEITPATALPIARVDAAAAYDARGDRMILNGGQTDPYEFSTAQDDTWAITFAPAVRSDSLRIRPAGPRRGHDLVYLPGPDELVMFGGSNGGRSSFIVEGTSRLSFGRRIEISASPEAAAGTVETLPAGCHAAGATVQLAAYPAHGWRFVSWSGDVGGSANPTSVTLDSPKRAVAHFAREAYALTIVSDANGAVTRTPDQASYEFETPVRLTAVPNDGFHFVEWSGDAAGTTNPLELTVDGDRTITAAFGYRIEAQVTGSGTVTTHTGRATFVPGTSVQVQAVPAEGWRFVQWGGDARGTQERFHLLMYQNHLVTAEFATLHYPLSVTAGAGGSVSRVPDRPLYEYGSSVVLTATPEVGHRFVGWSGGAEGTANPLTVSVGVATSLIASFEPETRVLALERVRWDPDGRAAVVSFAVPHAGPITLELFDLAGRRAGRHRIDGLPPGRHEARVTVQPALGPGVHFVRIAQGPASTRRKFVFVP